MPEGDSLVKTANRLRPALVGQPLVEIRVHRNRYPLPAPGTLIDEVRPVGKHLLITFADGNVHQTHLQMTGAWHLYRRGEQWRDEAGAMRALVVVPDHEAVLFRAPTSRLWPPGLADERPWRRLGPDLCVDPVDLDEVARRVDAVAAVEPDRPVHDVLMDQHVAAGIGNVYKSETLWVCRVDPFAAVGTLDADTVRTLYETASKLLRANLGPGRRVTYRGGQAVYGRANRGCPRCHTRIRMAGHRADERSTYWCPRCQPAG